MYEDTSKTWLERLRENPKDGDWQKLVDMYTPFIKAILGRQGITGHEADDVAQNVLIVAVRRVPEFDRQRTGAFRAWLRGITANSLRDYWRSKNRGINSKQIADVDDFLQQLSDPKSELTRIWNEEHDRHVLAYLLDQVKDEFQESTWRAFHGMSVEQKTAAEVATGLGITANAVFIARSRVLKRLREVGAELVESRAD